MRHIHDELPPDPRSVGAARRLLTTLLGEAGAEGWIDPAVLAASEVITNAVMHTGSPVSFDAWVSPEGVRVEVADASTHLPARREYAVTSGTGRGLHILDQSVERWGAEPLPTGKVVWFELGRVLATPLRSTGSSAALPATGQVLAVTLLNFPLLMHWAWQEHAQALLREYLLFALDEDLEAIDKHARASEALTLLYEQIPVPRLPDDPGELLADAVEPGVTAEQFVVTVPRASVPHFATLDSMLTRACEAAADGLFLSPPTQPEIVEMRQWICREVARQAAGDGRPLPWGALLGTRATVADGDARASRYRGLFGADDPIIATDESGVIVAAGRPALTLLGYESEGDLLGRRITVVIPERFHQAHIAGITLNATNGRRPLLDTPLTVPVVRSDGTEVHAELTISPRRAPGGSSVFVATFALPERHSSPTSDELPRPDP